MTSHTADPIEALLDQVTSPVKPSQLLWQKFGLKGNPFPSRAQPIWEVFHNQNKVRGRFLEILRDFLDETAVCNTRTLLFTGGNRVGKTHFMEHHQRYVIPRLIDRGLVLPTALVTAELCDPAAFVRAILVQVEESLRAQLGSGLFEIAPTEDVREKLKEKMPMSGLKDALMAWNLNNNEHGELLRRWYRGERIRASQRQKLGVHFLLDSFAPLLTALAGTISYIRILYSNLDLRCPGIIVFIDEFERIFNARRDRRGTFLQGIRSVLDRCAQGGLFLCAGMAVDVGPTLRNLEDEYPALYDRLKGSGDIPALTQVAGVIEAIDYAKAFLDYARVNSGGQSLFTNQEIEQYFRRAASGASSVPQGVFFDALHEAAEKKIRDISPGR